MKFKIGDTVQFSENNQMITGTITDINVSSNGYFDYSVSIIVGFNIVVLQIVEDELILVEEVSE